MKAFAAKHNFTFPYVIDETQEVARTYGAQCTPDYDTRSLQAYLGHKNIQNTTRYTALAPDRFKNFWKD